MKRPCVWRRRGGNFRGVLHGKREDRNHFDIGGPAGTTSARITLFGVLMTAISGELDRDGRYQIGDGSDG